MKTPNNFGGDMICQPETIKAGNETASSVHETKAFSERYLVQAAQGGQSGAFATLCERYMQQLHRAAQRITRSREDAEDAVQDALLRAFIHLQEFDGRSAFATWLTRIAINSALMILRKQRNALVVPMGGTADFVTGLDFQIADFAPNPEKRFAQKEQKTLVRRAIQNLRPALRQVVCIQQAQEGSMKEAAREMGISVAAAKARLFHAKAALRRSPVLKMMQRRPVSRPVRVLSAA
jgi:RNA polymerase sigma factor (sigma-70 family)